MATRQYVGARYVPKFYSNDVGATDWDNLHPFEPLTIVTHLGNSYTSKKPVPIGVDIHDTEYWALTSNFNAQLNEVIATMSEISERLAIINKRKYVFIADSYGTLAYSWIDKCVSALRLESDDYYRIARNSCGFRGDPNVTGDVTFINLLNTIYEDVTDTDEITDVVVCGGINDTYDPLEPGAITSAGNAFVLRSKELFPNARVHIGYCGFTSEVGLLSKRSAIVRAYGEIGGAVHMHNLVNSMHFLPWLTDTVHPNNIGSETIGRAITAHLLGGAIESYSNASYNKVVATPTGDFAGTSSVSGSNMYQQFDGTSIYFKNTTPLVLMYSSAKSIALNETWKPMFTIDDQYLVGTDNGYYTQCRVSFWDGSKWTDVEGMLKIVNKVASVFIHKKGATGTADLTLTNVTQIKLYPFTYIVPAISN